jgi:nucleotide-binding universal stress UspA family protein
MYRVIMAPTDLSDFENAAILAAAKLAQRFDAALHLVRVLAPPMIVETIPQMKAFEIAEQTLAEERAEGARELEARGTELRASSGVDVRTAIKEGRVTQTLRDYAAEIKADLIVMSSHSRGGLKRINLGSVTDYVIRNTHIPVLVVRPDVSFLDEAPDAPGRIVVPLDGSAMAEQILPEVVALASALKATVTVLHVLTPQTYAQKRIVQPGLPWWDDDIAAADAYLSGPADFVAASGVAVEKQVILNTDVAAAILDYATRVRANLIAVATNGLGGIRRFVFGTIADELTRKSAISLLLYHPNLEAATEDQHPASEVAAAMGRD